MSKDFLLRRTFLLNPLVMMTILRIGSPYYLQPDQAPVALDLAAPNTCGNTRSLRSSSHALFFVGASVVKGTGGTHCEIALTLAQVPSRWHSGVLGDYRYVGQCFK